MPNDHDEIPLPSVIVEPLLPTAWVSGAESGIEYKVELPSGDWRPWSPTYEGQTRHKFDAVSCVCYSGQNCLEPQLRRQFSLSLLPADAAGFLAKNMYLDKNGLPNFSDRFSAIKSGTTPNGNYMSNAPDSFRNDGLIPEWMLPFPEDIAAQAPTIGQEAAVRKYLDPKVITPAMVAMGQEFKKHFEVKYEVVWYGLFGPADIEVLQYHLKQAPLHFAATVCTNENKMNVIGACGCGASHARAIYAIDDAIRIFDSFYKAQKSMAKDFCIPYVYKIVIKPRESVPTPPATSHTFTVGLVPEVIRQERIKQGLSVPANNPDEVVALQKVLQYLKDTTGKPYLNPNIVPVPNFGPLTQAAVIWFQTDRKVAPIGEIRIVRGEVGPKTRAALNAAQ